MTYKAFEDWYNEADIKHLLLVDYNNELITPPFATELCKDYSILKHIGGQDINLNLADVTSKTNACEIINNDIWFIPYGIWDDFNKVVQIKNGIPIYHELPFKGKGQFYSMASNGTTGFSFPLGYEDTNVGLYINNTVSTIPLPVAGKKLHMGTVYCNGRYWSMPRGDDANYNLLLSFDGYNIKSYPIEGIDNSITRKYSDIIIVDNTLYALPFGETKGLNEVIEFDTVSNTYILHRLNVPDFAKKYNCGVLLNEKIIGLPYGEDYAEDSNWGIVFDTVTKESYSFDIGILFGGKYRYRSGIALDNHAYFFPSGTPSCPILKIADDGTIIKKKYLHGWLVGRPIIYNNYIHIIGYNIKTKSQVLFCFDEHLELLSEIDIT
tara:strand:- start:1221 stop:2360 length:1140 start_codon:yes stop_codon:yes gene_type:complete